MGNTTTKLLEALDLDEQGEWDQAHQIVQRIEDSRAYWVHAYLHRKEGDLGNASYWYDRANQPVATGSLAEEWRVLRDSVAMSDDGNDRVPG
jgi:hypothetical protein